MKGFEKSGEVKAEFGPASCGRWNGQALSARPLPQKRLYLHGVPVETLQEAPAETSWSVLFAFHATAARSVGEPGRAQASARLEAFHGHVLNWLGNLDGDHTLSLRFICDPDQGRLDLALIGKVAGPDRDVARKKADRFAGELEQLLQLNPYHRLRVVADPEELDRLLRPFSPKAVVEVQRTGMSLDIGLGRTLWVVKPFPGQSSTPTLETFLHLMLAQPGATLLDICFSHKHHEFQVQEIRRQAVSYLQELSAAYEYRPSGAGFLGDLKRRASLPDPSTALRTGLPQELLESSLRYLIGQLESLEARKGLWVKIRLAGEGERVSSPLAQSFISDFAGGGSWWESVSCTERNPQAEAGLASLEVEASPSLDSPALLGNLHAFYDLPHALTLFRFPLPTSQGVPGMEQDRLKILPLSRSARNAGASPEGFVIGEGFPHPQAEEPLPIALRRDDLRRHLYLCGKTGTGKSTLILRLICSLMEAGEGLCLIDPHGDLVEAVLPRVPRRRIEEVIFFNPEDRERPLGFNLLENDGSEEQQDFIVQEFLSMMFKLFHREWMGPLFERGLRSVLLLLMEADATLLDLGGVFSDEEFRRAGLERMRDTPRNEEVRRYWEAEFSLLKEKGELSLYVTSKFDRLLANATLRKIVGQRRSSLDISAAMDEGKILLVTLPKGVLGEMNAYMLGMILSSKIQMGALARAAIPPQRRRDFYLIVDEFHNLVSSAGGFSYAESERSFSSLLSEARKFGLSLILANQYIRQLDSGVREAVFGNTGSQIAFRVGAEDAGYLLQQFGPLGGTLAEEDFTTCPDYHAYAHLLVGGREEPPFTLRTFSPERMPARAEIARAGIGSSRERYGCPPEDGDRPRVNGRRQRIIASLKQPIHEVELSVRAYTGLVAANIQTIGELVQKTEDELRRGKQNLGRKSLCDTKSHKYLLHLIFFMM